MLTSDNYSVITRFDKSVLVNVQTTWYPAPAVLPQQLHFCNNAVHSADPPGSRNAIVAGEIGEGQSIPEYRMGIRGMVPVNCALCCAVMVVLSAGTSLQAEQLRRIFMCQTGGYKGYFLKKPVCISTYVLVCI